MFDLWCIRRHIFLSDRCVVNCRTTGMHSLIYRFYRRLGSILYNVNFRRICHFIDRHTHLQRSRYLIHKFFGCRQICFLQCVTDLCLALLRQKSLLLHFFQIVRQLLAKFFIFFHPVCFPLTLLTDALNGALQTGFLVFFQSTILILKCGTILSGHNLKIATGSIIILHTIRCDLRCLSTRIILRTGLTKSL